MDEAATMEWVVNHPLITVLWALSGVLSWGWTNHCAYMAGGEPEYNGFVKWSALLISPVVGPILAFSNLLLCIAVGKFYFGLRFR